MLRRVRAVNFRTARDVELELGPQHEQLTAPGIAAKLEEALTAHLGRPLRARFRIAAPRTETPATLDRREAAERHANAVRAIETDPGVRAVCDAFGARVEADQVRTVD